MTTAFETPATSWWQHPFRMFQTNLREIDAGLDVEAVTKPEMDSHNASGESPPDAATLALRTGSRLVQLLILRGQSR